MNVITDYIAASFDEVTPHEFYRMIFPEGELELRNVKEKGKYHGVVVEVTERKYKNGHPVVHRHTVTDDLNKIDDVIKRNNFCLMSPISYAGKTRSSKNARMIYAIAFDIDGIQTRIKDGEVYPYGLVNLFHQIDSMKILPQPTFIVCSGSGIHLYFVLERPIPYFKNILTELEKLKKELTRLFWHYSISSLMEKTQYEPICQGFRVVGTITKKGERCRAFKYGQCRRVNIEYLNSFVRDEYKAKEFVYKSRLTKAQAKEKYPEWYEKRIINKQPINTWQFDRAVYDKWLSRLKAKEQTYGHRYWSLWVLAVTAKKCGISRDELENDAFGLIKVMNEVDGAKDYPFTKDDVIAALLGYDDKWIRYPVKRMETRTEMPLNGIRRNGRNQKVHLAGARAIQKINDEANGTNWRENNGRKPKKDIVLDWRRNHPDGRRVECIRDTKLDKKTVYKWWNIN